MKKEFLQFIPTVDTAGKGLSNIILQSLQKFRIDVKYLRGQEYSMSGAFNGIQATIRPSYPLALMFIMPLMF